MFLDVDGTLLEIAPTPESVAVRGDTVEILERLAHAAGGAVALVSGRPIRQLDQLFGPLTIAAAGLHGLEWRSAAGTFHDAEGATPDLAPVRRTLEEFADRNPGVRIEDKGMTVALHYRLAPDCEAEAKQFVNEIARQLGDRFHVLAGKMVLEIKSIDAHKGMVVERFLAEDPFAGRVPVFVGDDVTDEEAFDAVNRHGGYSIRVGPPEETRTQARWRLESVSQVHTWLARVANALEQSETA
ncbi:MAG: trehalose-phosphatase [Gemmatimonadales bacterium]|nr:trehalose-phosphatase [Gemmatimonadales bacterium]